MWTTVRRLRLSALAAPADVTASQVRSRAPARAMASDKLQAAAQPKPSRRELDSLGTWDRLSLSPVLEKASARHGTLIPRVSAESVGVASDPGRRTTMEDRYSVVQITDNLLMLAVWDGHGGKECAEFCAENVALHLTKNLEMESREKELSSFGEGIDLESVARRLLVGLNVSFERHWKASSGDVTVGGKTPGTTATVALLRDGLELVVGHVGDSRCVLCRGSAAKRLTRDHCPSDDDERARIEKAGGFVVADNVGRHMVNGRLAMSRSIGDLDLKPFGVTAEPEVTRTVIKHSKDRFLLLASDGISFVMTDQEMVDCVRQSEDKPNESCARLIDRALLHASQDNVTALVLPLGSWGSGDGAARTTFLHDLGRGLSASARFG